MEVVRVTSNQEPPPPFFVPGDELPLMDKHGNPVVDADGNPVTVPLHPPDSKGEPPGTTHHRVVGDDGSPGEVVIAPPQ